MNDCKHMCLCDTCRQERTLLYIGIHLFADRLSISEENIREEIEDRYYEIVGKKVDHRNPDYPEFDKFYTSEGGVIK